MLATMSDKPADAAALAEGATGSASAADLHAKAEGGERKAEDQAGATTGLPSSGSHQAASTEPASFDQLVTDHQEKITRLVHRLLGWSGDVEDVVQDVFVDVLKNLSKFRGHSSVETWLTRIAINRCRSHQRREWLRRMLPLGNRDQESGVRSQPAAAISTNIPHSPFPTPHSGDAADQVSTQETIAQVHAAIRQLGQRDRELIVLRYLEEKPIDEIAQTLGLSRGTINVRLTRARARLEKILKPILEN